MLQLTESQKQEIKDIKRLLKDNSIEFKTLELHTYIHETTYYKLIIPNFHISLNNFSLYYGIEHIIFDDENNGLILIIFKIGA